ncbi:DUF86 domain-containing protein [Parabacteroides faecis]|uniref:HepT-like ribonuclease domain-containing protein n=1 Tax=Parabacteroides faecis TaxID=1217282 RepID=UPI00216481E7|nr:HepT-like ribonuclease domain-containing protein [Parabacteroides faecis]MCS2892483.1 DUF86 domain-containing protein [Parabacteroides faecis]UVQ48881.1 DUF86 domain-containing protein [Parabacteroides faecis]
MFDRDEILHLLGLIESTLSTIEERCKEIAIVDDFLLSNQGMILMDSVCMKVIALGESVKNLDKHTERSLLINYPEIPWKRVMGTRDIIVHHYFDIDADELLRIVKIDVPVLHATINRIIKDLN